MRRGAALALLAVLGLAPASALAQALTVSTTGGSVKVRAAGWSFLTSEPLARLKEGRTVRVELALLVLASQGRSPAGAARQIFTVSYDLWEERFAVARAGTRGVSISHLTAAAAEAWSVEQLAVPIASLAGLENGRFWIRLEYRILDGAAPDSDEDAGLTLQRLIDVLSRRSKTESSGRALDGGPYRLPR